MKSEYGWDHFVKLAGEEARRWLDEYQRYEWLSRRSHNLVILLRQHANDRAESELQEIRISLAHLKSPDASILHVLRRWFHAAEAYFYYTENQLSLAEASLMSAHMEIERAIGLKGFLTPLSFHCIDFVQQRARIARHRGWDDLAAHLDLMRQVYAGDIPLCHPPGRDPIFFSTLCDYYSSLPLAEDDMAPLEIFFDRTYRVNLYDEVAMRISHLPDLVIPYP